MVNPNNFIGGINATALTKFLQADGVDYKIALVSEKSKFVIPECYFGVSHSHIAELKLESATISAQCDPWSKLDQGKSITKFMPEQNKVQLNDGREYSYKALVVATGLNQQTSFIDGL